MGNIRVKMGFTPTLPNWGPKTFKPFDVEEGTTIMELLSGKSSQGQDFRSTLKTHQACAIYNQPVLQEDYATHILQEEDQLMFSEDQNSALAIIRSHPEWGPAPEHWC